ncbi:cuticle protein-like [Ischnura elegans]|uniref:cuticle protein-like n=1 Tax=Ischnura elegans TaxID=197161 RepID=UPI001ED8A17C|nr:cuticle protein-like [Ischnura elegans]
MASTKFIALAALFAVTNAAPREGLGYSTPDYSRRGTPAFLRTTPVYDGLMTSVAASSMATMTENNDGGSTARVDSRVFATTEMPSTESRYDDNADRNDNPSYSYAYDVRDSETGDNKAHSESLENGVVKGQYSVVDPNGVRRTVHYTADAVSGFNAVVNMEPSNVIIPAPKSSNAQRQFSEETSTERQFSTTAGTPTTVTVAMVESTQGPQTPRPNFYSGSPLVYRPGPVIYQSPTPRVVYTPVVHHPVPHQVQRVAISSTPVAITAEPVQKLAIYG